jgi:hypothetical protein
MPAPVLTIALMVVAAVIGGYGGWRMANATSQDRGPLATMDARIDVMAVARLIGAVRRAAPDAVLVEAAEHAYDRYSARFEQLGITIEAPQDEIGPDADGTAGQA